MPEQSNDYRVVVFGAGGVGKSSIVLRFVNGTFTDSYTPTVEDTYRQVISCGKQQNVCTLQITDTTGSHQFPAMQRLAISKGHAFILIYSIDKPDSFLELENIFDEVKAIKGTDLDYTPMMLVGNKTDGVRKIKTALGKTMAEKWGMGFIETSAKNDTNVTELFQQLLQMEKRRNLSLGDEDEKSKKKKKKKEKKEKSEKNPKSPKTKEKNEKNQKKEKSAKKEKKRKEKIRKIRRRRRRSRPCGPCGPCGP